MSETDRLLESLAQAHWELGEALTGLPDADVWRRADPRLLSVGEIVSHIAYGEVDAFLGGQFETPLRTEAVRYYPYTVEAPVSTGMGAEALVAELARVHEACIAAFRAANPSLESKNPYRTEWTWAYILQYMAFHVAYHAGQIYCVRHLLGHQTVDN
jgi:uncharacterized damage-inducible protein DinB